MDQPRTRYQEKVIKNYYRNREGIALQRAQELVGDLYLSTGKKREQVWKNLVGHLAALGVPPDQVEHLRQADNPALIADILKKMA
jgi:hypothetical protein